MIFDATASFMFVASAFVIWTIVDAVRRYRVAKFQSDLQEQLINKFASGTDLADYLRSESGNHYLKSLTLDVSSPVGRIVGAVQAGVVLLFVGASLLYLANKWPGLVPMSIETGTALLILGTLTLALGVGFVVAAAVSFLLSKSLGLLVRRGSMDR